MNNNPYLRNYIPNYNQQNMDEQIDYQINQLQQMKKQMRNNTPAINQTFQLAPTSLGIKYADSIEEVQKDMVIGDIPYFSKDMSILWLKNSKGEIKTYELNEIIPKDEKDIQIDFLISQIEELKGMIKNDANITDANAKQDTTNTTKHDKSTRKKLENEESTSISEVSGSEEE